MSNSPTVAITLRIARITSETLQERITELVRAEIGQNKNYALQHAAELLGIDPRTLRSYVAGENMPPFTTLLRMFVLFGPRFSQPVMELAGYDVRHASDAAQAISDFELNGDLSGFLSNLADALRDGRVDHRERVALAKRLREVVPLLQDWLSRNGGAA